MKHLSNRTRTRLTVAASLALLALAAGSLAAPPAGKGGGKGGGGDSGTEYRLTDLGFDTFPQEISEPVPVDPDDPDDLGRVSIAGWTRFPDESRLATVWHVDATGDILDSLFIQPFDGTNETEAHGVNTAGYSAGRAWTSDKNTFFAFAATPNGTPINLHVDTWQLSHAFDINNNNQVVGVADSKDGQYGVLWQISEQGAMTSYRLLPGFRAFGINDDGVMVGSLREPGRQWIATVGYIDGAGDFITVKLSDLRPDDVGSAAIAINEMSDVVGYSQASTGYEDATAWWSPAWGIEDLGLGGDVSVAHGINDLNQVVGADITYNNGGSSGRAFLWENGQTRDLNKLFQSPDGQKWTVGADDISNAGQIIGDARTGSKRNPELHGFVMTPLP